MYTIDAGGPPYQNNAQENNMKLNLAWKIRKKSWTEEIVSIPYIIPMSVAGKWSTMTFL